MIYSVMYIINILIIKKDISIHRAALIKYAEVLSVYDKFNKKTMILKLKSRRVH